MANTILVTGGAGYIGAHMVKALRHAGFRPVVLDDLSSGHRSAVRGEELHVGYIGDAAFVDRVLAEVRPAAVMHFAGFIQVGESVVDPGKYFRNNVSATQVLLDAMRMHGIARFIFSSTAAIFGEPQYVPIDEGRVADIAHMQFLATHRAAMAAAEVVQHHRPETRLAQRLDHVRADVAGAAGDQDGVVHWEPGANDDAGLSPMRGATVPYPCAR